MELTMAGEIIAILQAKVLQHSSNALLRDFRDGFGPPLEQTIICCHSRGNLME